MPLSETDDELSRLERDIRQLKIEYEQYFGGGRKRPPHDVEWRIELILKRYADRGAEMSYGQRFRYGNLTQTYAKYREIFHKRLSKREEGRIERHFGAAARVIEATREIGETPMPAPSVSSRHSERPLDPNKIEKLYRNFQEALEQCGESSHRPSRDQFASFLRQQADQLREKHGNKDFDFVVKVEHGKVRLKARLNT